MIPPAKGFPQPDLARIICFHLPCAFVCTGFLFAMCWQGISYLRSKKFDRDIRCAACTELAFLFACLTMATGILFSRVQWNAWWQWDPRQTSFLLVLLLLGGGLALRSAIGDEIRRARASAAFAAFSLIPSIFLIFVYPRLPGVSSFHPSETILTGGFDRNYWTAILSVFVVLCWASIRLYSKRVRAEATVRVKEESNAISMGGAHSTGDGPIRPVSLSKEDR